MHTVQYVYVCWLLDVFDQIGDISLGAGEIRAKQSVDMAAIVTVEALKIVESPNVLSDLESRIAPLNLTSSIPGRVNVAGIYKHHVVATLDCNMEIWVTNQTLKDYQCTQHVKLWFPFAMKGLQSVVLMGKCTVCVCILWLGLREAWDKQTAVLLRK